MNVILGLPFKIQILGAITEHLDLGRDCGKGDTRFAAVKGPVDQLTREENYRVSIVGSLVPYSTLNQKPLLRNAPSMYMVCCR